MGRNIIGNEKTAMTGNTMTMSPRMKKRRFPGEVFGFD
jgi:hypothetical protein